MPPDERTYKTEFPDFVLDVEIPEGFRDTSWHNDVCPSWERGEWRLMIDYADPAKREMPDSQRFVVLANHSDDFFEGDSLEAALAYIKLKETK